MLVIDAKAVRKLMVDRDISSVADLARRCKPPVNKNTLHQLLQSEPGVVVIFQSDTADRIARALGVPTLSILKEVPEPTVGAANPEDATP